MSLFLMGISALLFMFILVMEYYIILIMYGIATVLRYKLSW